MIPRRKTEQIAQAERFKNRIIVILLCLLALAMWKFATYPQQLTIQTAPDISKAFVQRPGDVPETTIYGFARTLWENLNYCTDDCAQEYPASLDKYRAFLTRSCKTILKSRFDRQKDFYSAKTRRLLPTEDAVFKVSNVKRMSADVWFVVLNYLLEEDIHGVTTRRQLMQYPLRITGNRTPTQHNPWGLTIDCFWQAPKVLKYDPLKEIK